MPGYVRFKPFGFVDGARLVFADTLHKHLLSARLLTFSMLRAWEAVFRWLVRRCAPFSAGDPTLRVPAGDELCWPVGSSTGSDAVAIVKTSNPPSIALLCESTCTMVRQIACRLRAGHRPS